MNQIRGSPKDSKNANNFEFAQYSNIISHTTSSISHIKISLKKFPLVDDYLFEKLLRFSLGKIRRKPLKYFKFSFSQISKTYVSQNCMLSFLQHGRKRIVSSCKYLIDGRKVDFCSLHHF